MDRASSPTGSSIAAQISETTDSNQSVKRKRDDLDSRSTVVQPSFSTSITACPSRNAQAQIADYVEVLKSHDAQHNVITRPILESSEEPPAKRKRADTEADSINRRAYSGIYSSLDHVLADVKDVCSSMLESIQPSSSTYDYNATPDIEMATSIKLFQSKAENILDGEQLRDEWRSKGGIRNSLQPINATIDTPSGKAFTPLTMNSDDALLALTLLSNTSADSRMGGRQGPKQLFSSIMKPVKNEDGNALPVELCGTALPPTISTTQICPALSTITGSKPKARTLGDLFSSKTASLPAHRPSYKGKTRSNNVAWHKPGSLDEYPLKHDTTYSGQTIAVGQWLDYHGQAIIRTSQHRAGSINTSIDEERLESMFKNVFSSFAPSRDDTAAIVPQAVLSRMHWQKKGIRQFQRLIDKTEGTECIQDSANTRALVVANRLADDLPVLNNTKDEASDIKDEFQDVIDFVERGMVDPELQELDVKTIHDKEVEELLKEVSELLETLNSYQRNRYLQPLTSRLGDSAAVEKPNEIETVTYNTLKAQLAFMIATLPPYAVTKLNSDQLSELNISTKVPVHTIDHRGVMDDDVDTQRTKATEMAARSARVAPISAVPRTNSNHSLYGNQYSGATRPSSSVPQAQYYSQTPVRAPAPKISTTAQPYNPRPPQSSYHGSSSSQYTGAPYPHQQPRQPIASYANSYYSTPTTQAYSQHSTYATVPMTAPQASQRYVTSATGYQPRPAVQPVRHNGHNESLVAQNHSPQKPAYSPQAIATPPSRGYSTPTPAAPTSRAQYAASAGTNGNSQAYAQNSGTPHIGETGFKSWMNGSEQSALMDRQRAQLAQQQQESLYRAQVNSHSGYAERPAS